MLLVHPVHELLRQIPVLIGSLVLGSATGNPMWALFGVALIVGYGLARWFTTSYRIGAEQVPRLRAILLADSLAPAEEDANEPGRELARWQPSWLRYSPLSFTGLAMILAAVGLAYQAGVGAALQDSRLARSGLDAAERFGVFASLAVVVVTVLVVSVVLSVLRSLVTYGNLV